MVRFKRFTFYSLGAKWIMAEYSLIHITCDELRFFRLLSRQVAQRIPRKLESQASERIKIDHVWSELDCTDQVFFHRMSNERNRQNEDIQIAGFVFFLGYRLKSINKLNSWFKIFANQATEERDDKTCRVRPNNLIFFILSTPFVRPSIKRDSVCIS